MPRNRGESRVYRRKDSPYWWASYINGCGKRVRRSTGVPVGEEGRDEAEALLAKWKMEAHQQRMWGREPEEVRQRHTFDDVMLAYLRGRETRTPMNKRTSAIKPLYAWFTGRDMLTITDLDVKEYVRHRLKTVAPGTVNKEVGALSAACNYCRNELGWDVPNPAARKKLAEPEGRTRWLSWDEAERLIDAARSIDRAPWLADFVQLCLFTGMRRGEVTALSWDRVDFDRRLVLLESGTTKNGKRRTVPLHQMAIEALHSRLRWRREHCPGSTWVFCNKKGERIKDMKRSFAKARKLAGIEDFRQHDQRHTLASWMVMSGVELIKVRDMLGQSSVKLAERYAHLHPDALRQAVDNLQPARNGHAVEAADFAPETKEDARTCYH